MSKKSQSGWVAYLGQWHVPVRCPRCALPACLPASKKNDSPGIALTATVCTGHHFHIQGQAYLKKMWRQKARQRCRKGLRGAEIWIMNGCVCDGGVEVGGMFCPVVPSLLCGRTSPGTPTWPLGPCALQSPTPATTRHRLLNSSPADHLPTCLLASSQQLIWTIAYLPALARVSQPCKSLINCCPSNYLQTEDKVPSN